MTWKETVHFLSLCLPKALSRVIAAEPAGEVWEVRVRAGRPVRMHTAHGAKDCGLTVTQEQVSAMAESLSEHALYARTEEARQGFVTLRGGHRMGLCGRVIAQGGTVRALREISSLNLRLAGQWTGTANAIMPLLTDEDGRAKSLLVVGMPGSGKTTLLRDVSRQLSDGGLRVCIADERSELAAVSRGMPQLDVGENTDVLDGCVKETAMRWLLRAMGPDVLVTDELGGIGDAQAVAEAAGSGIKVVTSVHGSDVEGLAGRSFLYPLTQSQVFSVYALMDPAKPGRIQAVYDQDLQPIPIGDNA